MADAPSEPCQPPGWGAAACLAERCHYCAALGFPTPLEFFWSSLYKIGLFLQHENGPEGTLGWDVGRSGLTGATHV